MKQLIMAMILLPAALWAQSGPASGSSSQGRGPSYSQVYCSGFITRDAISRENHVLGSKESPHEDLFAQGSTLFLRGPALEPGARFSILRQVVDPNREDSSPEQRGKLASLGAHYQDIGWATVRQIENGTGIASFDFACEPAMPGDIVVPFEERPQITLRKPEPLPEFRTGSAAVTGHILGARDFIAVLGTGLVVYTDFGSNKGAKPGDYLVISRGYAPEDLNRVDRISESLPTLDMGTVHPAEISPVVPGTRPCAAPPRLAPGKLMPNHVLGEMVILQASPDSSVAFITRTSAEVQLGDVVQAEGAEDQAAGNTPDKPVATKKSRLHHRLFAFHRNAQAVKDAAEAVK